jgi:hypothetical protein
LEHFEGKFTSVALQSLLRAAEREIEGYCCPAPIPMMNGPLARLALVSHF